MKTNISYQNQKLGSYLSNIFLVLILSLAMVVSCTIISPDDPRTNLNTLLFTYNAVEYTEDSTTDITSSPIWTKTFSSTGVTYSIAAATDENIPSQNGITAGVITIDSNTGVITVMASATTNHSGNYLVTATAGTNSVYVEESSQTATFSLTINSVTIKMANIPGLPVLRFDLKAANEIGVTLTPNEDNPYGSYSDGSSPTSVSYVFYYSPSSSFTETPTPQGVISNSTTLNISDVTERTNFVIPDLIQDTEYYIVVEVGHSVPSKTSLSQVFTQRTTSYRKLLCENITEIIATNNTANLNHIDTSKVTDMSYLFNQHYDCDKTHNSQNVRSNINNFKGNISNWNTSNVANMAFMFYGATAFNQDISKWNTSNVTNMAFMFYNATNFNGDISRWDTSKVTTMRSMFNSASAFNQNISEWNTSNVTSMAFMFNAATSFNQNISKWDTSNVTTMQNMFNGATSLDQDFSSWDVTDKVSSYMFTGVTNMQESNYPQGYTP